MFPSDVSLCDRLPSVWNGTPPPSHSVADVEKRLLCRVVELTITSPSVSQDFSQPFLSPMLSGGPPPPPPLPPPPDELEPPPKPPFADEEEEEEMLLRETCLMSMASKRVAATEVCV